MLTFIKYHSLANDFIIFDLTDATNKQELLAGASPKWFEQLCKRHTGVSADGVLIIEPDLTVRIINANGSDGTVCLNGIRCVAHYLTSKNKSAAINLRMAGQLISCTRDASTGIMYTTFKTAAAAEERTITTEKRDLTGFYIDIGSPHFIVEETCPPDELLSLGKELNKGPQFEHGVNLHFILQDSPSVCVLVSYERGVGRTAACSSGVVACIRMLLHRQRIHPGQQMHFAMPGGNLEARLLSHEHIQLVAPAHEVFQGTIAADF